MAVGYTAVTWWCFCKIYQIMYDRKFVRYAYLLLCSRNSVEKVSSPISIRAYPSHLWAREGTLLSLPHGRYRTHKHTRYVVCV